MQKKLFKTFINVYNNHALKRTVRCSLIFVRCGAFLLSVVRAARESSLSAECRWLPLLA